MTKKNEEISEEMNVESSDMPTEEEMNELIQEYAQDKLRYVQSELKAPKNQYNSFGKYRYRSCEDILEGVKPLLQKYRCAITLSDSIELIGDRYYVKATATFYDCETLGQISNTAYARESDDKKGMDTSQITGTASSYARKYALNGLLLIDDTNDADTDENRNEAIGRTRSEAAKKAMATRREKDDEIINKVISEKDANVLRELMKKKGIDPSLKFKGKEISELTNEEWVQAVNWLEKK